MNTAKNLLFRLTRTCTGIIIIASVLALMGAGSFFTEQFEHFRIQYLVSLIFSLIYFSLIKNKKWIIISLLFMILNFIFLYPYFFGAVIESQAEVSKEELKVMQLNVLTSNTQYKKVVKHVLEVNPDILVLEEVNSSWDKNLGPIYEKYPFFKKVIREDNFGIVILSKFDLKDIKSRSVGYVPIFEGTVKIHNKDVFIMAVHPVPPASSEYYRDRNKALLEYQKTMFENKSKYKLLLGDLNITPWCYRYFKFLENSKLRDSARGYGLNLTWPSGMIFPLGIKLDHIFHNNGFLTAEFYSGPDVGSDHRSVTAKLNFYETIN